MSKTFIFLAILFLCAVSAYFYVKYVYLKNVSFPTYSSSSIDPSSTTKATLSFSPDYHTALSGQISSVNIMFASTDSSPKLIQLEIGYNPNTMSEVQLFPGDYFIDPKILFENIDIKTGRISYSLSSSQFSNKTSGIVATMYFLPLSSAGQTTIRFLPKTTIRGDKDFILNASSEAKIIFQPPIITATPSAVLKK